jgi:hypothetical protein
VNIDGLSPLSCECTFNETNDIRLKSINLCSDSFVESGLYGDRFMEETDICSSFDNVFSTSLYVRKPDVAPPPCILLKACLYTALGLLLNRRTSMLPNNPYPQEGSDSTLPVSPTSSLTRVLGELCDGGFNVTCKSLLPPGSGLGGSSILAAVILKAIFSLLCQEFFLTNDLLVTLVLNRKGIHDLLILYLKFIH